MIRTNTTSCNSSHLCSLILAPKGRVKAVSLLYTLMGSGSIFMMAPPASLAAAVTAEALVDLSVGQRQRRADGESLLPLPKTFGSATMETPKPKDAAPVSVGGMKMELNDQVRKLKQLKAVRSSWDRCSNFC